MSVVETQCASRNHRAKHIEGALEAMVIQEIGIAERETRKSITCLVYPIPRLWRNAHMKNLHARRE